MAQEPALKYLTQVAKETLINMAIFGTYCQREFQYQLLVHQENTMILVLRVLGDFPEN